MRIGSSQPAADDNSNGSTPRLLLRALAPVIGVFAVALLVAYLNPLAGSFRSGVPVEKIAFERVVLGANFIDLRVRNDGPDPISISQVLINEAYLAHEITDRELDRREAATIRVSYPWDEGTEIRITLLTATGTTALHVIEAAVSTPRLSAPAVRSFLIIGLAVGVAPVAIGLLWLGMLRQMRQEAIDLALAFTVGLLVFLLGESIIEGLEAAGAVAKTLNGIGLFAVGALLAVWATVAVGGDRSLQPDAAMAAKRSNGLRFAYLLAIGIGLHNFGEGLAIGNALATGSVALGVSLIVGFMVHNLSEGFAIATPLGNVGPRSPQHFVWLVLVAGAPTIPGSLLGGSLISAAWTALFFGMAAGSISQVAWVLGAGLFRRTTRLAALVGSLLAGYVTMYATGLFTV